MARQHEAPRMASVLGPPAIVALTTLVLSLIPGEVRIFVAVWTLASFPIGVLFGRCVLSEN